MKYFILMSLIVFQSLNIFAEEFEGKFQEHRGENITVKGLDGNIINWEDGSKKEFFIGGLFINNISINNNVIHFWQNGNSKCLKFLGFLENKATFFIITKDNRKIKVIANPTIDSKIKVFSCLTGIDRDLDPIESQEKDSIILNELQLRGEKNFQIIFEG